MDPPLKFLLDTGANQSFISPEAVTKYFPGINLNYDPFIVTNIHASTMNQFSVTIPCFSEFRDANPIKLFVYKFHDYFDGLIGCDLLEQWQANIDLSNRVLSTQFADNQICMHVTGEGNLPEENIPAQSSKLIKVPTTISNGEIYIDEQLICDCSIQECISMSNGNYAYVEILNPTQNDITITLSEPIHAQLFNEQTMQFSNTDTRTHDVLSRLRTHHLNEEEACNLMNLCREYSDVFYVEGEQLTFTNQIKHAINTTDEIPVYSKTYRYPYIHREEVQNQIQSMLRQGIIRPSTSAWSAPIWVVPKKSDASGKVKWRLVVDFRKLNDKTIDDKYPIPNIVDILDKLGRCQYFTTLDLASGFYQVEMEPKDIHKTGFNVERGHYEFLRMPMGLKNSPSTFQRVMDNVLQGVPNTIVYLDDILVFSTSLQEHIVNLKQIFQRLRETNFKIQMDKSEFLKRETPYLGHVITPEGVKPNPDKISAILKYPIPKTTKQIKGFLGLLGYYRRFIPDFAKITKPLTTCLKKGSKIVVNSDYIKCFEHCKTLLINDPILVYPDFTKEFILTTDSSNFAIGAVLSQIQGPTNLDHPIAYASRTLNDSEVNYSTTEKELLAIVWATKYFRPYLFGRKFKIITDHKPLQWLMNLKEPSSRLTRWRLKLSEYDFTIIYKKGTANTNADALSRIEINNEQMSLFVNASDIDSVSSSSTMTAPDQNSMSSSSATLTAHTSAEDPILEIPISTDPLNKFKKQLVLNVINRPPRTRATVTKPFEGHIRTAIDIFDQKLEESLIETIKNHIDPKTRTALFINPENKIYRIIPILQRAFSSSAMNIVLVKRELQNVQSEQQQSIVKNYHEGKTNHRGVNETFMSLSQRYFWPKMRETIAKYISTCNTCSSAKYDRNPLRPEFTVVPPASKPFQVAHADVLTIEQEKYLTIIDSFSKYAQAYYIPDCSGPSIIKALLRFSTHHGFPLSLTTDQGTEFVNQVVSEFLQLHNVEHKTTMPYAPNQNGLIERFHSTLIEHLRILKLKHKTETAKNLIPYALIAYNSSMHSLTKCRPFEVISGHFDPRDPINVNLTERLMQQYISDHRDRMETVYHLIHDDSLTNREQIMNRVNQTREPQIEYEQNQEVFFRNPVAARQKLAPRFKGDKVTDNLPIHIYTSKNRGPVAKIRLKRPLKHQTVPLLQIPNTDLRNSGPSTRDTPRQSQ